MITIERHDIKKLEDYIKNIERYRRELKVREYELLENHEPENVEQVKVIYQVILLRESIKKLSDNRYNNLRNIVKGVDKLIYESDEDTQDLMRLRYWECPIGCSEWEDIAEYFGTSKTSILRRRDAMINRLAEFIGYV